MRKFESLLITVFLFGGIFLGTNVSATTSIIPDDLFIDFRDEPRSGAYGRHESTAGDVTAAALPTCRNLYQDDMDGIGIPGGEPDDINYREKLKVNGQRRDNEFSLAGFTPPIPQPTTLLLVGCGLVGIIGIRRRK